MPEKSKEMRENLPKEFQKVGFWAPRSAFNFVLRPRLWRQVLHAPVSVRFEESEWSRYPTVVRWTYSQNSLRLTFTSKKWYEKFSYRWRTISDALSILIKKNPTKKFSDVPVDISDCLDASVPQNVFRFSKSPFDPHDLIPNPFLLEKNHRSWRQIQWDHKKDSLFFRGALTGKLQSFENSRVAACIASKTIPNTDCKLSSFPQTPAAFVAELKSNGLSTTKDLPKTINRHRYQLDIDGNSSSWHRFWLIGTFGCVPIRFETKWVEYWHQNLEEGKNYLYADRETLINVVDYLRSHPEEARSIARNASEMVQNHLSSDCVQKFFEEAWLRRID